MRFLVRSLLTPGSETLMKYRASRMHKRFYHEDVGDYHENYRERLLLYTQERSFQKPAVVWFDNIKVMLEAKIDPDGRWMKHIEERIYPENAKWFTAHTQMMYLAFCTTSIADDEFLLTENAYGIHDGPNIFHIDPDTRIRIEAAYTEYRMFAVISTKLIMVLRSFLFLVPGEDTSEKIRNWRENMYRLNA